MSEKTAIAWTDHTFNIAWGCVKVSEGCKHCYAEGIVTSGRFGGSDDIWGKGKARRTFGERHWKEPLAWDRRAAREGVRRRVFCSSMCDVFEDHPTIDAERAKLWELVRRTPNLDWQILTKRPERIATELPEGWGPGGWPNVWLGTSIESGRWCGRAGHLRSIPAVVRFVSYEPALGPLDALNLTGLDWVIYGGESGPNFRKEDKQWARDMRDRCREAGVAFFHKQSANRFTERGIELDGEIVREYPTPRQGTPPPPCELI